MLNGSIFHITTTWEGQSNVDFAFFGWHGHLVQLIFRTWFIVKYIWMISELTLLSWVLTFHCGWCFSFSISYFFFFMRTVHLYEIYMEALRHIQNRYIKPTIQVLRIFVPLSMWLWVRFLTMFMEKIRLKEENSPCVFPTEISHH
jgi:hypothetical protein